MPKLIKNMTILKGADGAITACTFDGRDTRFTVEVGKTYHAAPGRMMTGSVTIVSLVEDGAGVYCRARTNKGKMSLLQLNSLRNTYDIDKVPLVKKTRPRVSKPSDTSAEREESAAQRSLDRIEVRLSNIAEQQAEILSALQAIIHKIAERPADHVQLLAGLQTINLKVEALTKALGG